MLIININNRELECDFEKNFREKVEEMKIIQKLREKATGVNVVGLALGENVTSDIITVKSVILLISGRFNVERVYKMWSVLF